MPQHRRIHDRIQDVRRSIVRGALRRWLGHARVGGSIPTQGIHRILLLRPNHRLGNTLLLTPLLTELDRAYPGAEVDVLSAGHAAVDVFSSNIMVRNIWSLPRRIFCHPLKTWNVLHRLRGQQYDLAIDPCISSQSGRLLLRSCKATHKLGFVGADLAGGVTCGVAVPYGLDHMAQLPVQLLRSARGESFEPKQCPPLSIGLTSEELAAGRAIVGKLIGNCGCANGHGSHAQPLIGVFGDASGAKLFPEHWWASVLEDLKQRCPNAVFLEIVPGSGQSRFDNRFSTYFSTSIRRMAAVMAAMDLVVSADCGVMHLAVASGTATAGIFNVTSQKQYGPYGSSNYAISAARRAPWEIASDLASYLH